MIRHPATRRLLVCKLQRCRSTSWPINPGTTNCCLNKLRRAALLYFPSAVNPTNDWLPTDRSLASSPCSIAVVEFALSVPDRVECQTRGRDIPVKSFTIPLHEVDPAITDGEETGFVKVHVKERTDRILGATIVARHAGEMINEVTLAMVAGIGLRTLAGVIHAYPTQAEAIRMAADAYCRTRLPPTVRSLFTPLARVVTLANP